MGSGVGSARVSREALSGRLDARERDELHAAMNARSQAIGEACRDVRTRAGRAEAEADALRHELAGLRTAAETGAAGAQASGKTMPRRTRA